MKVPTGPEKRKKFQQCGVQGGEAEHKERILIWAVITTSSYKYVLWMSSLLLLFGAFNIHYKSCISLRIFEIKLVELN